MIVSILGRPRASRCNSTAASFLVELAIEPAAQNHRADAMPDFAKAAHLTPSGCADSTRSTTEASDRQ